MSDIGKRYGDRQTAMQADRTQQKALADVIEQLRDEAQFLSERSADRKTLADSAQPLYASLDDQQKRRYAKELIDVSRWPAP
jgi:fructose-1,6-bisphosphatase/inositol monophosphatase family enzyme